ncbi:MAG: 50S ribosomal protein L29 [Gammaproteobacteria bacterium]|jgi:large subunit ribosomal protein L29
MNASELKEKTAEELQTILLDLRKEQFNLRMQQGTGQLSRPHQMKQVKKDIARVHTVMNQAKAGGQS